MNSIKIWLLVTLSVCGSTQGQMMASLENDSVIFQAADKRLIENERSSSDEINYSPFNFSDSVILRKTSLPSDLQIIEPEIIENSSSVRYSNSNNSEQLNSSRFGMINNSFQITKPELNLFVLNTTFVNVRIINVEGDRENKSEEIESEELIDSKQSQVESSQNNKDNQTINPVEQGIETENKNPETQGYEIEVTTNSNDDIVWSDEVTEVNKDDNTVIIFTNLYSPGEDVYTDLPEKSHSTEGNPIEKEMRNDEIKSDGERTTTPFVQGNLSLEGVSTETQIIIEQPSEANDEISLDQDQMIRDGSIKQSLLDEETSRDNADVHRANVDGSFDAEASTDGSTSTAQTDQVPSDNVEDKYFITPIKSRNQVRSFITTSPPVLINNVDDRKIDEKDGTADEDNTTVNESENSTVDKNQGKSVINRTRTSNFNPGSVPLRTLPQNRKDIKTLIEEKRRSQSQTRKIPSFRLNSTRLNREPVQTISSNTLEKLIINGRTATTDSPSPETNEQNKVKTDIYSLEESARKSGGDCVRECGSTSSMTCRYELTLEWFHTMSKACFSCPRNVSDCFRPHCISTDGVKRTIAVINRSLPGPLIQVCEGDTIVAKVTNLMIDSTTTIHWHGQHQLLNPYMDGVPSVTQCPIQPGVSFTYSFTASQSGTHFYHSHSGVQRGDGAFGGFIVRRALSKERHRWTYDYDLPEHTVQIHDWSHRLSLQAFTHHHHAAGSNKPDTILVNGRGVTSTPDMPPASFTVDKGSRYRFRLINAGVLNCPMRISIDNHRLTIIATDGNDIQPYDVDWLVTYAGERWDFVLAANADISNYWMRFIGLMDCDERFTSAHQGAVLHYNGASVSLPPGILSYNASTLSPRLERQPKVLNALNAGISDGATLVHQLRGLARVQPWLASRQPDRKIVLAYDFNPMDNEIFHKPNKYGFSQVVDQKSRVYTPQLNHISLKLPSFPLLTQSEQLTPSMLCTNMDQEMCKKKFCECTNIIDISLGEVVEVIFIDQGFVYDANHPFHLHGHAFYVVGMDRLGSNVTRENVMELDRMGLIDRNLGDPPLKDTVTVPDGGYTIVRFIANNPGYWLLHCHIDFHAEVGMAVVLHVGTSNDLPPKPRGFPTCGDFDPTETTNEIKERSISETLENSVEDAMVSVIDTVVNPSFGSKWKYNMSSSSSAVTPNLKITFCLIAVILKYPFS